MAEMDSFYVYDNGAAPITDRGMTLPEFELDETAEDPKDYLAGERLVAAVNAAIHLGQPLVVTGKPGTGKTRLAHSIAYQLKLPLHSFYAKTTSAARDLFYRYDSLAHFHDSLLVKEGASEAPGPESYVDWNALGLAILLAQRKGSVDDLVPKKYKDRYPTRSVVLIDEIDKAPRDLPNDVLNEIEQMEFTVRETGRYFHAEPEYRPIVVITNNSEKNLPDAFLRRCIFCHIEFPDHDRLKAIVDRRLGKDNVLAPELLDKAITHFEEIQKLPLSKKPSTPECIAWVRILEKLGVDADKLDTTDLTDGEKERLALSYCVLTKNLDDLNKVRKEKGMEVSKGYRDGVRGSAARKPAVWRVPR